MSQYELWSVLGQWAGSISTTIAVIVALYTARLPYTKKIDVKYSTGIYVDSLYEDIECIITATNVGQRDVKINMIGFLIEDKQLFMPTTVLECQKIIKTAECVEHSMSYNALKQLLQKNKFPGKSKIYAFVKDGEGKVYKTYIKAKVNFFTNQ